MNERLDVKLFHEMGKSHKEFSYYVRAFHSTVKLYRENYCYQILMNIIEIHTTSTTSLNIRVVELGIDYVVDCFLLEFL